MRIERILLLLFMMNLLIAYAQPYQESPILTALVESGELPPVEERLPEEPLVLDPVEEIGQYGGTWRMVDQNNNLGWVRNTIMVEPFLKFERDLNGLRPNIVSDWTWNDDATELVLHLRRGVKWSDGEPLTVDDYLFWWNDMVLNESIPVTAPGWTRSGGELMTVEKIDDYTLRLSFLEPNPLFFEFAARGNYNSAQHIIPSHYMRQFHPDYSDATDTDALMDRYGVNTRLRYSDMPTFLAWRPVSFALGQLAVFERNPYYWKVDSAGNQLPYIDRLEVIIPEGDPAAQVVLRAIAGELDMQVRDFPLRDMPLIFDNADTGDYRVIMWSRGDFAWPWLMLMYDYPDEFIVDLMYEQRFREALSVAINRQRINDIVALGLAQPRQATLSSEGPEFQSPEGQRVYEEWANLAIEYDPQRARELLDELNLVDSTGDGFRNRPDGSRLELVIDVPATDTKGIDTVDLIEEDWAAIGLRTIINVADGAIIDDRANQGEIMIRSWPSAAAWGLTSAPTVWAPVEGVPWTIGGIRIGRHFQTGGADGVPPRAGSALERLQQAFAEIIVVADPEERYRMLLDAYQIHIDEGPLTIGTVGLHPSPVVVKNNFRNVQDFGLVASHDLGFPGTADPEQFFIRQ